jgi:hypothetical protein
VSHVEVRGLAHLSGQNGINSLHYPVMERP